MTDDTINHSIKQAIALAGSPKLQLHMLANMTDMEPYEVLAIARVHAVEASMQADEVIGTCDYTPQEAVDCVQYLRDNPHPEVVRLLGLARKPTQRPAWRWLKRWNKPHA